jgi:hypothetical protein
MWIWINCNLLGRHREIVTSDRATIHLRCVCCGHRTAGWPLVVERRPASQPARLWQQPAVQEARHQPS